MKYKIQILIVFLIVAFVYLGLADNRGSDHTNPLLQTPEKSNQKELLASFLNRSGTYGPDHRHFTYKNGSIIPRVLYEELPDTFTDEERALFTPTIRGDKTVYVYSFGEPVPAELSEAPKMGGAELKRQGEPQPISLEALADLIKERRIVFFTGAGISASAGIHTIASLKMELGLSPGQQIDDFVIDAMHNPEEIVQKIHAFYRAAKMSAPTPAHLALAQLAIKKKTQVLTGNFDLLHERSGIVPYRVFYRDIETDLSDSNLKDIDMIVAIGMSQDIRGVLEKYYKANLEGAIVSINPEVPVFLGENDYFLQGDAQDILPELVKLFNRIEVKNE